MTERERERESEQARDERGRQRVIKGGRERERGRLEGETYTLDMRSPRGIESQ